MNKHKTHKRAQRRLKKLEKKAENLKIKFQWKTLPKHLRPVKFSSDYLHRWNVHEEIANSITHGIGALLGVAALVLMVVLAASEGSTLGVISGAVFGVSVIIAFLSSMIYHAVLYPPAKQVFKILDHSSIFLLIAGTYTPFCLITLHGPVGWALFGTVWTIAIAGIALKCFFIDELGRLSLILYLLMGWISVSCVVQLVHALPWGGIIWLVIGGLCYTIGVIFFIFERVPFFHTVWHLFVLAGSIAHFFAIFIYVLPVIV